MTHFVKLVPSSLIVVSVACAPGRDSMPGSPPDIDATDVTDADPWMGAVAARIRDEAYAFARAGAAFEAEVPEHGIRGHFDEQGARLEHEDGGISVQTIAWGRGDSLDEVSASAPSLGACTFGAENPEGDCVQRLEYANHGLVEWWAAGDDGFEQGWTVDSRPAGDGDLVIAVEIEGATATLVEGDIWLDGDGGGQWMVAGLVAWDADGVPLEAWFTVRGEEVLIAIADAGARYPLEVDPVYTTATTSLAGASAADGFGVSVSGGGDIDGDGYDDIIVGASSYSSSTGRAYIFPGSPSGVVAVASSTLTGEAAGAYFGCSVSSAGDVNGDGYGDVVVGSYGYSSNKGRVYVYAGSSSGLSGSAQTTITGATASGYLGGTVGGAGDVNGDSFDDIIAGSYTGSSSGGAFVFHGSSSGVGTTVAATLGAGSSVSGAGDVNADGFDDVIVGDYASSFTKGQATVFLGSSTGVSTTGATTLTGTASSNYFGFGVAGAEDVDGDGYDDVIVGAFGYASRTGRVYLYRGSSTGIGTTAASTLTGTATWGHFGWSVASAGDVDNDGFADIVVGAYGAIYGVVGSAFVYRGAASGLDTTAVATFTSTTVLAGFGRSVDGAGDVDGDGYDDVVVGASGTSGGVYLYHGYANDTDGDGDDDPTDCDDIDPSVYTGAVEVPSDGIDQDCDGVDDCFLDADGDTFGGTSVVTGDDLDCADGSSLVSSNSSDCDDTNAAINPSATELCDAGNTDEDCDGTADNDDASASAAGKATYYLDADADGYGSATTGAYCDLPSGYTSTSTDCDDDDASDHPGATETVGNGDDEDCDGGEICYDDTDDDGYRSESGATRTSSDSDCDDANEAKGTASTDCDDTDASVSPGASEVLDDGIDQDCDGLESCPADADGDGYAAEGGVSVSSTDLDCVDRGEATGVTPATDCDDADATVNPGAVEVVADGIDEDCDAAELCYDDDDDDGSIDMSADTRLSTDLDCDDPMEAGGGALTTDCDDADPDTHAGASEVVGDGIDEDCDGKESCFDDDDDDGYLDPAGDTRTSADTDCDDTSEAKSDAPTSDCDDANGAVYPGAPEFPGDGIDEDCDGRELCPVDADGDGYADDAGTTVSTAALDCAVAGVVDASAPANDCDDADATVYPGAPEATADGEDQNCDGVDACYLDADRDSYGSATVVEGDDLDCGDASSAVASRSFDCDDSDAATYPSATEIVGDGIDADCDGHEVCYVDADDDGVAAYGGATTDSEDADCADAGEAGAEIATTDCDDADPGVGEEFWYIDADGDAYGDDATRRAMCDPGSGFVRVGGDCSDHDATVFPGTDSYDQVCGDAAGAACGCSTGVSADPGAWSLAAFVAMTLPAARRRRKIS